MCAYSLAHSSFSVGSCSPCGAPPASDVASRSCDGAQRHDHHRPHRHRRDNDDGGATRAAVGWR
eukprot:CAMPEP_0177781734 /NCGR_PEP_ID=MMETSP0491_2-20121128/18035_1 /TAXON_ID=63592 /ORGANISM="Tetraselmis chuii, Strain PLY429" /LENGTH=63 /DNA_ID=CAMNT_0019301873 /DNA_START=215 /DNA_END=403 /DNA_ORIENTATION=-